MSATIRKSDCYRPRRGPDCPKFGRDSLGFNAELDRFYLNQQIRRRREQYEQKRRQGQRDSDLDIDGSESECSIPADDLLTTNRIDTNEPQKIHESRFFKFMTTTVLLNSNSRIFGESQFHLETETVRNINPQEPEVVVPSRPPRPVRNNNITTTRDDVLVAATVGGEPVTAIREGDFVRALPEPVRPDPPVPTCEDLCPPTPSMPAPDCVCDIDDTVRLGQPRTTRPEARLRSKIVDAAIANQIAENTQNSTNDPLIDRTYMGREQLLAQVHQESGQPSTQLVPPLECDPALVLGLSANRNNLNKPPPRRFNNTSSLGGLKPPKIVQTDLFCVSDSEFHRFMFKLDRRYSNVKSVKLVSSAIPQYDTIINPQNNQIIFQILRDGSALINRGTGSDIWEYSIPIGNFTPTQLGRLIQEDVNNLILREADLAEPPFEIRVDELRNRFEIRTEDPYTFSWEFVVTADNSRSLYQMLGFSEPKQVNYTDQFVNQRPFRLKTDDYVLVEIVGMNQMFDSLTKSYYFNRVFLSAAGDACAFDRHLDIETVFDNAEGHFEYIDARFFNQDGQPIDFGRTEFSLVINIVEYADRLMGQNLNTRRGFIDYTTVSKYQVQKLT